MCTSPGLHLQYQWLTPHNWNLFTGLFGEKGACGGCWCMYPYQTNAEFEQAKGPVNCGRMRAKVEAHETPGILAIAGDRAVGWCALGPKEQYPRLARSRLFKQACHPGLWSIVCLFVRKSFRRKGISTSLLHAVKPMALERGATILEGYSAIPKSQNAPALFLFHGTYSAYRCAGFSEVGRPSPTRVLMRAYLLRDHPADPLAHFNSTASS